MNKISLLEKYCIDGVSLNEYKMKKNLRKEISETEDKNYKTHKWKSDFVKAMKQKVPSFNGSVGEVERIVMSARLAGLNPVQAAEKAYQYYSKFKPGTNGYAEFQKMTSKFSNETRAKAPKERAARVDSLKKILNKYERK